MKYVSLLILFFVLTSCSNKTAGTKSSFKLIMGSNALSTAINGGAYVETEEITKSVKTLIKLDSNNSADISFGTYNMLFVAFAGPELHTGNMYCGSVANTSFREEAATVNVKITAIECADPKYNELINKITGNNNSSKWDKALFDQGKWSP